jgi:hypothetical protein
MTHYIAVACFPAIIAFGGKHTKGSVVLANHPRRALLLVSTKASTPAQHDFDAVVYSRWLITEKSRPASLNTSKPRTTSLQNGQYH